jgi:hypothetical protein
LRYLVVLGSDSGLPMTRVADPVTLSPQFDYAKSLAFTTAGLTKANAMYAAAALGFFLTDDALATFHRTQWRDSDLFLPEISVSRLVESPTEIVGQLQGFMGNSVLDPATLEAVTAEIGFLTEGVAEIDTSFANRFGAGNTSKLTGLWDSLALLASRTGRDVWSYNAHHDHFRIQPESLVNGTVTANQLLPAPADPAVPGFPYLVSFTMGCNAGLNVPDDLVSQPTADQATRLRDLPQAYAQNRAAVYIANLGYAYGETAPGVSGLSEKFMAILAEELTSNAAGSFGEKLVRAKHRYFGLMGTYGDFDFKVLQEVVQYGPPWFRLGNAGSAPPPPPQPPLETDSATGLQTMTYEFNAQPLLTRHDDPERGSFWTADGDAQVAHYRMPQPRLTRDIEREGFAPRGVELVGLVTDDVLNVDPFLSTPTVACPDCEPESGYVDSIYPASFVNLNSSRAFGERLDTLVLIAGQFRPTTPPGARGIERLVHSAAVRVYSSTSADRSRPLFLQTGATRAGGQTTIWARASDRGTGIGRVSALYTRGGTDGWHYVELQNVAGTTLYQATVAVTDEIHVMYTAVDRGGNSAASTGKGFLVTSHAANPTPPEITIGTPLPEATFVLNDRVLAAYACSDADGVRSCAGPVPNRGLLDTSTPGRHTFRVDAEDLAGNRASLAREYDVRYLFSGFARPIDPQILNVVNAGRTVPVKWQLRDAAGAYVRNLTAVRAIESATIPCGDRPSGPIEDGDPVDASSLKYDAAAEQFVFNWKTARSQAGTCVRLTVSFADGTARSADFQLR